MNLLIFVEILYTISLVMEKYQYRWFLWSQLKPTERFFKRNQRPVLSYLNVEEIMANYRALTSIYSYFTTSYIEEFMAHLDLYVLDFIFSSVKFYYHSQDEIMVVTLFIKFSKWRNHISLIFQVFSIQDKIIPFML